MSLEIQIEAIAYTFLFGIVLSFFFNILYRILFTKYFLLNFFTNLIFNLSSAILYFYFLFKINSGIIHIYFFFIFLISFFLYNRIFKKIRWVGWWFNKVLINKFLFGIFIIGMW